MAHVFPIQPLRGYFDLQLNDLSTIPRSKNIMTLNYLHPWNYGSSMVILPGKQPVMTLLQFHKFRSQEVRKADSRIGGLCQGDDATESDAHQNAQPPTARPRQDKYHEKTDRKLLHLGVQGTPRGVLILYTIKHGPMAPWLRQLVRNCVNAKKWVKSMSFGPYNL